MVRKAPLPEALWTAVSELNGEGGGGAATPPAIRARLAQRGVAPPPQDTLHAALGTLVRERRLCHNGTGYIATRPDIYYASLKKTDSFKQTGHTQARSRPPSIEIENAKDAEKLSLLGRWLRRVQEKPTSRHSIFSAQFPPPDMIYGQSVSTQTQSSKKSSITTLHAPVCVKEDSLDGPILTDNDKPMPRFFDENGEPIRQHSHRSQRKSKRKSPKLPQKTHSGHKRSPRSSDVVETRVLKTKNPHKEGHVFVIDNSVSVEVEKNVSSTVVTEETTVTKQDGMTEILAVTSVVIKEEKNRKKLPPKATIDIPKCVE